jgi:ubiquinol-cytochrome c reductase subunit 6
MGFFDTLSDLVAAAAPWSAVEAEAVSDATTEAPAQSEEAEVKVRWLLFRLYVLSS